MIELNGFIAVPYKPGNETAFDCNSFCVTSKTNQKTGERTPRMLKFTKGFSRKLPENFKFVEFYFDEKKDEAILKFFPEATQTAYPLRRLAAGNCYISSKFLTQFLIGEFVYKLFQLQQNVGNTYKFKSNIKH